MEEDAWLTSWCLHDEQERFEKEELEMQQAGLSRMWNPVSSRPEFQRSHSLERQLALRLLLREFDFNVDSHVNVEIR